MAFYIDPVQVLSNHPFHSYYWQVAANTAIYRHEALNLSLESLVISAQCRRFPKYFIIERCVFFITVAECLHWQPMHSLAGFLKLHIWQLHQQNTVSSVTNGAQVMSWTWRACTNLHWWRGGSKKRKITKPGQHSVATRDDIRQKLFLETETLITYGGVTMGSGKNGRKEVITRRHATESEGGH